MKIFSRHSSSGCPRAADAKEKRRQGERAFTMIEIAIAIGVIGFALVAVIGILPLGLNSQKNAREDALINQDAAYFMDAIRNGIVPANGGYSAQGLDFLTNYVQSIRYDYVINGITNTNLTAYYNGFISGAQIIGLLSTPQTNFASPFFTNTYFVVSAVVRSLSGPATEQNSVNSALAFTYRMDVMITPFNNIAPDSTNYAAYLSSSDPNQWMIRSNRFVEVTGIIPTSPPGNLPGFANGIGPLACNLFDVRLHFSWPVYPSSSLTNTVVGPWQQTYNDTIAAQVVTTPIYGTNYWSFVPQNFATTQVNGL